MTTHDPLALPPLPLHRAREAAVRKRWLEWKPRCIIEARRLQRIHPDSFDELMTELERVHRSRLSDLAYARIPWTTIRRNDLDDPRNAEQVFQFALHAAVERRKRLLGCRPRRHTRTQGASR